MNCPKCSETLQAGQLVAEQSPGEWAALGLWLVSGMMPLGGASTWYFERFEGDKERIPLIGRPNMTDAYHCPKCDTFVITSGDSTREQMVARWKALTSATAHEMKRDLP